MKIKKRLNFVYNLNKIINKFQAQKLAKFSIENNLFVLNKKQTKIKSILLYLDDEQMMHLGDHLFFEPLAKHLTLLGFKLFIYPTKIMEFYFNDVSIYRPLLYKRAHMTGVGSFHWNPMARFFQRGGHPRRIE